jgi:hypothetical protein
MNHTRKTRFFFLCLSKYFRLRQYFPSSRMAVRMTFYLPPLKRGQMVLCQPEDCQNSEGYGLNYWGNRGLIPVVSFFFFAASRPAFEVHHTFYPKSTGVLHQAVKRLQREDEYSPSSAETKIVRNYTSTNRYVFMQR